MDPCRGGGSRAGFCGDAPHGGGTQEVGGSDEVVGEPLPYIERSVRFVFFLFFGVCAWKNNDIGGSN